MTQRKEFSDIDPLRDRQLFIERMKNIEIYFQNNIKSNILFKPEYDAVKEINIILSDRDITKSNLTKIIEVFNSTNKIKHYNGSGWLDLELHLRGFISTYNLTVKKVNRDIFIKE
jgi:hypothetical protein